MARTVQPTKIEPAALSIGQLATYLQTSSDTVRRLIDSGELPAFKLRSQWRVSVADLHAYEARQRRDGKRAPAKTTTKRAPRKAAAAKTTKTATTRKRTR
jgi:excisionase family DNA binding protein